MIAVLIAQVRADRARRAEHRALARDITATTRALDALGRATRRART